MFNVTTAGYVENLVALRGRSEDIYIRRFNGIHEERFNYVASQIEKYGLHATLNMRSLGFEIVERDLMISFFREWINIGQNHARNEIATELRMAQDPFQSSTKNAQSYYDAYAVKLSKVTDQALLSKTKDIIREGIKTGETTRNTINKLSGLYPSFSKQRLENIVRTESGKCYNWGRLVEYYSDPEIIYGVRFSAVLDGRTTDICIARNGMVIPLTEQGEIASNTPPLHYQCRSIWTPIVIGMTEKKYQSNWEERKGSLSTMPPMDGFGYKDLSGIIPQAKVRIPVTITKKVVEEAKKVAVVKVLDPNILPIQERVALEKGIENIDKGVEHAFIVDPNGKILLEKGGGKNKVGFDYQELKYFRNNLMIHNHPSNYFDKITNEYIGGWGFSYKDILTSFETGLSEIQAIGKYKNNVYLFSLKIPKSALKNYDEVREYIQYDFAGEFAKSMDRVIKAKTTVSSKELNYRMWDFLARNIANKFGLMYKVTLVKVG